jgi:peptide/nickel transport system ATP-binding protein
MPASSAESDAVLMVHDLSVEYRIHRQVVKAVNGISFVLKRGESLGLVGETGAGKTTTALSLMRLLPDRLSFVTGGRIILDGQDVMALKLEEMRALRGSAISMVFQDPMTSLNPIMTIGSQIKEALRLHNDQGLSDKQLDARVEEVLEMVGIQPSRKNDYPLQFSGGMKQRVVIAMALACEPKVLLADEPTTALDVIIQAQVLSLIMDLRKRLGTSMLMITHDLGIVARTCDHVAVMYAGEIVEYGSIEQIFDPEAPHHPYTVGLFGSIPRLNDEARRLTPIEGLMPDPTNLPEGCSFSPRCPRRMEQCLKRKPGDQSINDHRIRCFLYSGGPTDE